MEVKDLFLLIYQIFDKYDLLSYYVFEVKPQYIDVIPQKGTIGNDVLHELVAIDACICVSTNETGVFARLTPKS